MVDRDLFFDMDALSRYPMVSRMQFIECSGNSYLAGLPRRPINETCGFLHGLVSCSEWTGVPLSILLDEAGVDPDAHWIMAEGADAAAMNRSVPLAKAMGRRAARVCTRTGNACARSRVTPCGCSCRVTRAT